jgi:hypothetical protein
MDHGSWIMDHGSWIMVIPLLLGRDERKATFGRAHPRTPEGSTLDLLSHERAYSRNSVRTSIDDVRAYRAKTGRWLLHHRRATNFFDFRFAGS